MKRKKTNRIIATFFLVIFFPTILPVNVLYASNNGPGASDFRTFEPVDATDMVNLVTGDLSYVLPLLNVPSPEGGYPLALSYHSGIALDQEASWVGLGWSLNAGAINRNTNSYPDDIGYGSERYFAFDEGGSGDYYSVGIGGNINGISVGVGASWGSNKSLAGSVALGYNGFSASASSEGDVGIGYSSGSVAASSSTGTSMDTKGGVGLGTNQGFSSSSFSYTQDDYSVKQSSSGFNISNIVNLHFGRTKIKYSLFKDDYNKYVGSLYPLSTNPEITYQDRPKSDSEMLLMYDKNTSPTKIYNGDDDHTLDRQIIPSLDGYNLNAQGLNGSITIGYTQELPVGYTDNQNPILDYYLNPIMFAGLDNTFKLNDKFFYEFKDYSSSFLRINRSNISRDISAENNKLLTTETLWANDVLNFAKTNYTGTFPESTLYNANFPNGVGLKNGNRKRTGKHVESFTNSQIISGLTSTGGWFLEANNLNRNQPETYAPEGIGAFRVTDVDGKVYHYSLPVINYETWYKNFMDEEDEDEQFVERMLIQPYATDWLLTAVTGPDYVDTNNNQKVDEGDYGYWVEFDYGKWSDGYIWNTSTGLYDVVESGRDSDQTYEYHRGRKQIYYLDAVRTRTHTAYFVKSLRKDSLGQQLDYYQTPFTGGVFDPKVYCKNFQSTNRDHRTAFDMWDEVYMEMPFVNIEFYGIPREIAQRRIKGQKEIFKYHDFPLHYSLKLDKIVLVKNNSLIINKANGIPLRTDTKAYLYDNSAFDLKNTYVGDGTQTVNELYFVDNIITPKEINIHQSQNVIDANDIAGLNINQYAERIITFDHDYKLRTFSPNSIADNAEGYHGKLTLNKVNFLGKQGVSTLPGYTFAYRQGGGNPDNEDGWGYDDDNVSGGCLEKIVTPTGTNIHFNYEQDDYSGIAAKVSRLFEKGLRFNIIKNSTTNNLEFTVYRNTASPDNVFSDFSEVGKCFTVGQKVGLDMFICRRSKYGGSRREVKLDLRGVAGEITAVTTTSVSFKIPDSPDYWHFDDQNASWILNRTFSYTSVKFTNESNDGVIMRKTKERNCYDWRDSYDNDDVTVQYRLASSNISNNEKGGGVRVRRIEVQSIPEQASVYKYYYNQPGFDKNQYDPNYKSSGITSYAPSKDVLIIPYDAEIPAPLVMYKNVSVEHSNSSNETLQRTDYVFEVLSPYSEDVNSLYKMGDHLNINRIQNDSTVVSLTNYGSTTNTKFKFSKHQIKSKISNLGRVLSISTYNSNNHLLSNHINSYVVPQDAVGEIGSKEESFISKNWFNTYHVNSLSKIYYPNALVSTTSMAGGHKSTINYDNPDFLTGLPLETTSKSSDGKTYKSVSLPAYKKYLGMGAKTDNIASRNMLTQNTAEYSYILDDATGTWKNLDVGITTWNNIWNYKNIDGTMASPVADKEKIWRVHKDYVWDGAVDNTGIMQGYNSANDDGFSWTVGVGTQPSVWKLATESTLYDHYSTLLESKDINSNLASIKMGDKDKKVIAKGNAGHGEMFYSGGEYQWGGYADSEVRITNSYPTSTDKHTGRYGISTYSNSQFGVFMRSGQHKAGKYKVSVWVKKSQAANARLCINSGSTIIPFTSNDAGNTAGDWILKTAIIDVPAGDCFPYLFASTGVVVYDDLRIQPISSSMTSYVYNEWDEVSEIIAPNNLSTRFEYDAEGRVIKTYVEVVDDPANNIIGGFKLASKNEYHNHITQ